MKAVAIRAMRPGDWPEVEAIYHEGLATGNASFEAEPPVWEAFDTGKLGVGRLVAVDADGGVTGWVAASAVSTREVYRGVVAGQWRDTILVERRRPDGAPSRENPAQAFAWTGFSAERK